MNPELPVLPVPATTALAKAVVVSLLLHALLLAYVLTAQVDSDYLPDVPSQAPQILSVTLFSPELFRARLNSRATLPPCKWPLVVT